MTRYTATYYNIPKDEETKKGLVFAYDVADMREEWRIALGMALAKTNEDTILVNLAFDCD